MNFGLACGVPEWFGLPYVYGPVVLFLIICFACASLVSYLTKLPARRKAKRQAHHRCTQCSYDLRAAPHRCPECAKIAAWRPVTRGTGAAAQGVQRRYNPAESNLAPLPLDYR